MTINYYYELAEKRRSRWIKKSSQACKLNKKKKTKQNNNNDADGEGIEPAELHQENDIKCDIDGG